MLGLVRLMPVLMVLIAVTSLSGVQGQFQEQYSAPPNTYPANAPGASDDPLQYSQFYNMISGPVPSNPIGAPQPFDLGSNLPSALYFGEQMQPIPYSQYQASPAYTGSTAMWIEGTDAWTQYAMIPQGAIVSIIALSPSSGSGLLVFEDSDGQIYSHDYFFYPNSLVTFYADKAGRHIFYLSLNGQTSNQVVIDVTPETYSPQIYHPLTMYYPDYYPREYYPWYYAPNIQPATQPPGEKTQDGKTGHHQDWDHGSNHGADNKDHDTKSPDHIKDADNSKDGHNWHSGQGNIGNQGVDKGNDHNWNPNNGQSGKHDGKGDHDSNINQDDIVAQGENNTSPA